MSMIKSQLLPDGYATIRSRGLSRKKSRPTSATSDAYDIPILTPKFDSEVVYSGALNGHILNGDIKESFEDVENELDVIYKKPSNCDSNTSTFKTFKPNHSTNSNDGSCKDLRQSNDYFHSMPYDMMLPPLKSPQYINQLNVMRSKTPTDSTKVPLYARPESPKYVKVTYNRSASPSADSLDNCSSTSSNYSTHTALRTPNISNVSNNSNNSNDDEKLIQISRKPPIKVNKSLQYRKSFSHLSRNMSYSTYNGSKEIFLEQADESDYGFIPNGNNRSSYASNTNSSSECINYDKPPANLAFTTTLPQSLANPSISTSQLYTGRYNTIGHQPKINGMKSTPALYNANDWNSLDCKIGCQTTLRSKPRIPWYELAIKKDHRQSCPPIQVIIILNNNF